MMIKKKTITQQQQEENKDLKLTVTWLEFSTNQTCNWFLIDAVGLKVLALGCFVFIIMIFSGGKKISRKIYLGWMVLKQLICHVIEGEFSLRQC